ncbi:MAG: TIGR04211 family SH3 domain-containing protein [Pseudomonadales bacterium]|jgi:SH3 domain protein
MAPNPCTRTLPNGRARRRARPLVAALIAACCGALLSGGARAETAYISDTLTVPLRSGPSNANRILHRGLPSGTRLEVLGRDDDSGFVQVRTEGGMEGWLPEQYLVAQPIARDRLVAANRQIEELRDTVARQRAELDSLKSSKNQADSSNADLSRQVESLQAELAEIKRVSAGAIAQNETNKELMALNERLRGEVDELVNNIADLEDNVQERWLLIGGGLVLAGLVLGVAIKARPRRSAWS